MLENVLNNRTETLLAFIEAGLLEERVLSLPVLGVGPARGNKDTHPIATGPQPDCDADQGPGSAAPPAVLTRAVGIRPALAVAARLLRPGDTLYDLVQARCTLQDAANDMSEWHAAQVALRRVQRENAGLREDVEQLLSAGNIDRDQYNSLQIELHEHEQGELVTRLELEARKKVISSHRERSEAMIRRSISWLRPGPAA